MNERVLVIDDELNAVEGICDALALQDITCRGHTNPAMAIQDFLTNPTDVVIVDYHFPPSAGMTGIDIIRQLQAIKPFTQFILISGMIDRDLDEEALTSELRSILSANRYIAKPIVDTEPLVATVREALLLIETQATDWEAIARQYVSAGSITAEEVRQLNERIKSHLIRAIDEPEENA
jgi:CheY-like chemotaxis protein